MKTSLQFFPSACKEQISERTGKKISNRHYNLAGKFRTSIFIVLSLLFLGSAANAQSILGNNTVCAGATTTLTLSGINLGGVWSSDNQAVATVDQSGVVYGVSSGTANIAYTLLGLLPLTTPVTVNASPNAGTISGFNAICIGNTVPFTTNGVTGGVWGTKYGFVSVDANGNVTGQYKGMDTVKYTVTNGTCSSYAAANISVVGILDNIYTYAGNGNATYTGNNVPAFQATVSGPRDLYVDTLTASVYFCDQNNQIVRKISSSGIITTVAGNGTNATRTYSLTNGMAATAAALSVPNGVFSDKNGNVFISNSNSANICKVNASGILTVIAGQVKKAAGATADGGPATAANIGIVYGIVEDPSGAILFVDQTNNAIRKISKSDGTGILTTVVGSSGVSAASYTGDGGPGTAATLNNPVGITMDNSGNLYISDGGNNVIRKLSPSGIITTIAGSRSGTAGYSGDGGPATAALLNTPARFAYDGSNNLYISDQGNNVIRQINLITNTITTVAGIAGAGGYNGDDRPATTAQLNVPAGIAADHFGNFFISDATNNRIRFVNSTGSTIVVISGPSEVCAGTPITLTARSSVTGNITYQWQKNGVTVSTGSTVLTNSNPVNGDVYQCVAQVTPVCGSPFTIYSNTITLIVDQPAGTISGITGNVCIGSTNQLSDVAAGGVWSSSNTLIATISTAGVLTGVAAGSGTVTYTEINACNSSTVTLAVNVSPEYTITASAGANGSISQPGVTTVCGGNNQSYIITPNSGYYISNAQVDGNSIGAVASYTFSNISANHTINATFAPSNYTIIASTNGTGSGTITPPGTAIVSFDASGTYTIAAAPGSTLTDVTVDGIDQGVVTTYTFSQVSTNHTIIATFTLNTYILTASTAGTGSGTITPVNATVSYGGSQAYTVAAATGSTLTGVTVNGQSVDATGGSFTIPNVTANQTIIATFTLNTYTLTASTAGNGSGTISPSGSTTVSYGGSQAYTVAAATGSTLTGVTVNGQSVDATGGSFTIPNVTANQTIIATFTLNTYTLAASTAGNGSGTITPANATVSYGGSQAYTVAAATGSTLTGVTVNGQSVDATGGSFTIPDVTANQTIIATFTLNTYTLTASTAGNGSGTITPANATVNYGGSQAYTVAAATGSTLTGVTVDGNSVDASGGSFTISNVNANHNIVATFTLNTYTLTASTAGNGSGTITPANATVNYGGSQTYTVAAATGSTLTGVTVDGNSVDASGGSFTISNVNANHNIVATFTLNTYTLAASIAGNGSGTITPANATVNYGGSQTYTVAAATGSTLTGVTVDGQSVSVTGGSFTINDVIANHNIVATFTLNTYTLTASTAGNGSGTITPANATVNYGGSQAYTVAAATGSTLTGVTVNGQSVDATGGSFTIPDVTANQTIIATFTLNTYTLTASTAGNGSGTITPANATVNYGGSQTYTVAAATGSTLTGVTVDGNSVDASGGSFTISNVNANHNIVATFTLNTYTLAASTAGNGSGTITPANATVNYGGSQAYTVAAATGSTLTGVTVDGNSVDASVGSFTISNVNANHNIVATFTLNTYTLAASTAGNGSGTITPANATVNYGGSQAYTVAAATGSTLTGVTVNGQSVDATGGSFTIPNVTANQTIVATFTLNTYTLAASTAGNGSGTITPANATVNYGGSQAYTVAATTGSTLTGVTVDGNSVDASGGSFTISNVNANHNIVATFTLNTYTLTASTAGNGSGTITPANATVSYGGSQAYTVATATGSTLTGVTVDGQSVSVTGGSFTINDVIANHNIVATFTLNTYTLTASTAGNGSGTITPVNATVSYGGSQAYTVAAATGSTLTGVTVDGQSVSVTGGSFTINDVIANHNIVATFTLNTYTLTASTAGNGSGTITPVNATVNYGGSQAYTVAAATGSTLTGVTVDGQSVSVTGGSFTINDVIANHNIVATFTLNTYTLTASTAGSGSGTITPVNATVSYGGSQAYTVAAATGSTLTGVTVDGQSVSVTGGSYTISNVTANHNIIATFTLNTYTLAASTAGNGSGTITPVNATVNYGGSQAYTVAAATGSTLTGVTVDGQSVSVTGGSFTINDVIANHNIVATFTLNTYTLTASKAGNGSGTITPVNATVSYGGSQAYTVAAATGSTLTGVTVDGQSVSVTGGSFTITNVTSNHNIIATFTLNTYTLTASKAGNGSGTITPVNATVSYGGSQAYTVAAATGSTLTGVTVNGQSVSVTGGSFTITNVTANQTIIATFTLNTYTITASACTNGSISPSGVTTVNYDATPSYIITPATGYSISSILVNGTAINATYGTSASYTYTFGPVTANETISATFVTNCVAPVISACPANVSVNNTTGLCSATATYSAATVTGTSPTITYSQNSGTTFSVGTTTVTVTATNSCGTATSHFTVQVVDNQAPSITAPANVTINGYCESVAASVVGSLGTPTTSDVCGGTVTVTNNAPSTYPAGTTTVTWTATDKTNGKTATATQTVTISPSTITITGTITPIPCGGGTGSIATTVAGGTAPYTYKWSCNNATTASVSGLSAGTYNLTVTDAHGCTATGSYTIAPAITASSAITGSSSVLGGVATSYTAPAGMTSYSWSVTTGSNESQCGAPTVQGSSTTSSFTLLSPCCNNTVTYTIKLTTTNGGCSSTSTMTVTVTPSTTFTVYSCLYQTGTGYNPTTTKTAIPACFKVYDRTVCGARDYNQSHYCSVYGSTNGQITNACISAPTLVNVGGGPCYQYTITAPANGYYLVLGQCNVTSSNGQNCTIYTGGKVGQHCSVDQDYLDEQGDGACSDSITRFHCVLEDCRGNCSEGVSQEEYGTLMLIVSPASVVFTDSVAMLPVIYEAVAGSWQVSVSAGVPNGFIPSPDTALSTSVTDIVTNVTDSVISAVQFAITDTGSDWTFTKLTHQIMHKGVPRTAYSAPTMVNLRTNKPVDIYVYPNPADDVISIVLSKFEGKATAYITDMLGHKVAEQKINSIGGTSVSMDISKIPNGIYLVTVENSNGKATTRLVKTGK